MPTTQITEFTGSIDTVAARTDDAGGAVTPDWRAEERRMAHQLFTPGIVGADAWEVVAGAAATMNVVVGSGAAEVDLAFVAGQIAGQGTYLVRLDEVTKTIALDAAGASARTDEVYLVVYDHAYDAQSRVLPRFAVRKGDAGGAAPGPDANWEAYLLLASVAIPASAPDITTATITDERVQAALVNDLLAVGAITTDKIADDAVTGAKASNDFMSSFEVDGSVEVASPPGLTSSQGVKATVNLVIPADWGSWKCEAYATYDWIRNANANLSTKIRIDGVDQQHQFLSILTANSSGGSAVGGRRTGMTTTGSRAIDLMAASDGVAQMGRIFLYARAVRTS